jgi:hypothetical protein
MKFLLISYPTEQQAPPSQEFMAEMGRFVEAETKAGRLLATGGLLPVSRGGARVRSAGGKFSVIDGPFTESKELIAGFALIEVASLDEAIDASRRFYKIAGEGEGEIRQVLG